MGSFYPDIYCSTAAKLFPDLKFIYFPSSSPEDPGLLLIAGMGTMFCWTLLFMAKWTSCLFF
jgi:hypothetical protein